MATKTTAVSSGVFSHKLAELRKRIDTDLEKTSRSLIADAKEHYGEYSAESMRVFCDVLSRGGKRIRGSLAYTAYIAYGGTDRDIALAAARIMELAQTYLLVVDDVYDRSRIRRGKPSAHVLLEDIHTTSAWKGDSAHFGSSIAFNSGLIVSHLLQVMLTELELDPALIVKASKILNSNLAITGEGQANDVFNEVIQTTDISRINNVLIWKTAYYTFVNPLQFGAVLAGANDEQLEMIKDFSVHAGRTFQITDDIIGIFSDESEAGKSPMDDIREGKRTILTLYALENAEKEDAYFLESMLGNKDLSMAEFRRCREIIFTSGALARAREEATYSANKAKELAQKNWPSQAEFFTGMIEYLLERKS